VSVREPRRLPVVLSPEEVGRLLASTTNIKQKAVLSLTYATCLRASEVISLKLTDIDSDRMVIRVEQGKGKKDRYVILSPNLLELLREWWRVARKKGWLYPGQPLAVSRLPRAAHECAPAPPARSHGSHTRRRETGSENTAAN
jgi:integrase